MKLKALIATLVLGSSSVALAAPEIRDHRTHRPAPVVVTPAPAPISVPAQIKLAEARIGYSILSRRPNQARPAQWVTLADNMKVHGRAVINLQSSKRLFKKLELRADGKGRIAIDKVMILFGNGQRQVVDLDAKLGKNKPMVSIDLAGETRNIDRIVLVGKSNGRNASVDVRAL